FAAGHLDDLVGESLDGDFVRCSDIVDPAGSVFAGHELDDGVDHIAYITETTRLLSGAVDVDWGVGKGGLDEARDDHPVLTGLTRAEGVEEAGDDDGETILEVVGEAQKFVDGLRAGVGPAGEARGPEHGVIVFPEWDLLALAVDFAGGGDEDG